MLSGRISLSATGYYKTPKLEWDRIQGKGRPFFYFAYGAAITEVVVDKLTGENRILRADVLHDAGASLNPALDVGQVEGAYVQGAGWLTTEELVWDPKGAICARMRPRPTRSRPARTGRISSTSRSGMGRTGKTRSIAQSRGGAALHAWDFGLAGAVVMRRAAFGRLIRTYRHLQRQRRYWRYRGHRGRSGGC